MVDYRKFLGKSEELVLPWLGGGFVETRDRRLRLTARPPRPGWYRFTLMGRAATPGAEAEPDLALLPRLRGNLHRGWLFVTGAPPEELLLLPEEEAPMFQAVTARRFFGGEALFEALDFDGDGEEAVRLALDDGTTLKDAKSVTPALRMAFAWELVRRVAIAEDEPVSPTEIVRYALDVADGGALSARRAFDELVHARRGGRVQVVAGGRVYVRELIGAARRTQKRAGWDNVEERVEDALHAAGARLLGIRRLPNEIEVRFRFLGDTFACLADPFTLQIRDAGVCLVDHETEERGDEQLTLDSLPSVLREAIDGGFLVHTRR